MAFRTDGLDKAYTKAQNESIRIKAFAKDASAGLSAGNVSANAVIQIMTRMKSVIEEWDKVSSLVGIGDYAKSVENDPAYDVAAEFIAMRSAAVAVRDWVINNFPSAGGFIQKDTLEADGAITVRPFTPVQTVALQGLLNDLDAAIELS